MCSQMPGLLGASPAGSIDLYAKADLASSAYLLGLMVLWAIPC